MTDKQRGALAATMWFISTLFGVVAVNVPWHLAGPFAIIFILLGTASAIQGHLIWSAKT